MVSSFLCSMKPKIIPETAALIVKPGKNGPVGFTMKAIISESAPITAEIAGPKSMPETASIREPKRISINWVMGRFKNPHTTDRAMNMPDRVNVFTFFKLDIKLPPLQYIPFTTSEVRSRM